MNFDDIAGKLKGKLFLSSMLGWTDAMFCASRAKGFAMVQLGAFVLFKDRKETNTYWHDPDSVNLKDFMKNQFDTCRNESAKILGEDNVPIICANIFPCTDADVENSAKAFIEAGGDIYELNAHGGIGGDRERGTGKMLFLPEHTPKLMRWADMLVKAGGSVIIKGRAGAIPDYTDHVKRFEQMGIQAFHINIRDEETERQNLKVLETIRNATDMFLLASGYVRDAESARALFSSGADCVGIAKAAMSDPDVFVKCEL